jgi:hypothetical protein
MTHETICKHCGIMNRPVNAEYHCPNCAKWIEVICGPTIDGPERLDHANGCCCEDCYMAWADTQDAPNYLYA